MSMRSFDVLVAGGGVIGLASAVALAGRGLSVALVSRHQPGEASPAAGGLLAPSLGVGGEAAGPTASEAALRFAVASRDRYPAWLDALRDDGHGDVPLTLDGVLQVAFDDVGSEALHRAAPSTARWLDHVELAELEPALVPAPGALLHPGDGVVDNVALLRVLERAAARCASLTRIDDEVVAVELPPGAVTAQLTSERIAAGRLVLAAGAWAPGIRGLPRAIPVEPVRGQMLEIAAAPLRRPVFAPGGYLIPHPGVHAATVAGSTMERVGFDPSVDPAATDRIHRAALRLAPALGPAPVTRRWAGLRPMTPDLLPILAPDPDEPALIYACGHSKNGILMAPLTAECVAALATGAPLPADITGFGIERFAK